MFSFNKLIKIPVEVLWRGFSTMSGNKTEVLKIGTHDGVFHCDEVLACFILKQLPHLKNSEIIRTRDSEILNTCDYVVDVGGEYNHPHCRYDHHQRSFSETMSTIRQDFPNKKIKLSSAGLIYAHFGEDVICNILQNKNFNPKEIFLIYKGVYETFVEELDAIDNGVPMYDGEPKYRIGTHLSARVHNLNPEWNSPQDVNVDKLFEKAMALVGEEFTDKILYLANVWLPARNIVKEAVDNRFNVHPSGNVIVLNDRVPWKEHLFNIEEECDIKDCIKFCLFTDTKNQWRVQGVPIKPDSFVCRIFLHKDWQGVRDDQLSEISGISGSIFCHATGFIGGNKTKEGALEMALKSIESQST